MNADLLRERRLAKISSEEFAEWWAGGREELEKRRALEKFFYDDPEFIEKVPVYYLSHKEQYEHAIEMGTKFVKKLRDYSARQGRGGKADDIKAMHEFRLLLSDRLGTGLMQQSFPLRLHFSMFLPTLLGQGTEQQHREWLQKAWEMNGIIGTYAQTELGHGTFIRGLETRADYDEVNEEFILNTPSLTAYKFWPGGLGQAANMVVVMAQLYVKGKHCGLHPFLVRIRNEETHMPESGVDVGEIGPKVGVNGVNNGFLGLRDVRIPRSQMLMRNAQVLADGTFVKGPEPLLTYGTMVFVRVVIVQDVAFGLQVAATIATSPIEPNQPEPQIIDHLTQQAKVFPQVAKGVFFRLTADYMWTLYQSVMKELNAGNRRNLPELHALSCCLKAVCSHEAAAGIETLRKACGGHGYLSSANFQSVYGTATAACTYEGENTVLLLQTARFLVKNYVDGLKRKVLPQSVTYLRYQGPLKWSSRKVESLVRALEVTAAAKVAQAFEYQRAKAKEAPNASDQWASNRAGIKLTQAATMHGRAFLARCALQEWQRQSKRMSPALAKVFTQLLELFVLELFLESLGDIVRFTPLRGHQLSDVEVWYEESLNAFRPNAVVVVDGFDFHDRILGSTLGCYDGRVYERLMEEARKSPLNQDVDVVHRTFESHLKPFMRGKL